MKLKKWAFFCYSPDFSPEKNTVVNKNELCELIIVGFDYKNKNDDLILDVAKKLIDDGVQMIELCGGFSPVTLAKLINLTNGRVPIGLVTYGPEFRQQLLDLMS